MFSVFLYSRISSSFNYKYPLEPNSPLNTLKNNNNQYNHGDSVIMTGSLVLDMLFQHLREVFDEIEVITSKTGKLIYSVIHLFNRYSFEDAYYKGVLFL